jgi:hypothetical protein
VSRLDEDVPEIVKFGPSVIFPRATIVSPPVAPLEAAPASVRHGVPLEVQLFEFDPPDEFT